MGKTLAVLGLEAIQLALIVALGFALGWHPHGDPLLAVLLLLVGTVAFGALGLLLAGALRAEVTLAAANLVWLILLFCGGIAVPLSKYPHGVAQVLRLLPSAALSDGLHQVLQHGDGFPVGAFITLLVWAAVAVPAASRVVPMGVSSVWRWLRSDAGLRATTVGSIVANVLIVITGGAVRLTASGLGCPTWPRCTDGSLVRTQATGTHGVIEFTNRSLTFALLVVAVATLVAAIGQRNQVRLAAIALAGIPAQAVLGGISVLTHLNPWVVSSHLLLLAMAILAVTVRLWWRVRHPVNGARPARMDVGRLLARLVVVVTALVLVAGTIVTGSGPHAGTAGADGHLHRNGLSPASTAQLHADLVMILIGLTVGLVLLLRAVDAPRATFRAAVVLLVVELAQGLIGFVQYFTRCSPPCLVGFHMAGACAVWVAALVVLLRTGDELADGRGGWLSFRGCLSFSRGLREPGPQRG